MIYNRKEFLIILATAMGAYHFKRALNHSEGIQRAIDISSASRSAERGSNTLIIYHEDGTITAYMGYGDSEIDFLMLGSKDRESEYIPNAHFSDIMNRLQNGGEIHLAKTIKP